MANGLILFVFHMKLNIHNIQIILNDKIPKFKNFMEGIFDITNNKIIRRYSFFLNLCEHYYYYYYLSLPDNLTEYSQSIKLCS